ncbi:LEAF RUST 10 DISEASE-RESISTANCE LOCUS RECEPTOR-LIKE PROTEIN KINASE-like 2.4 [Abrus precatorius]|uniref:LEAF RUST 10 DISEASE-RESISTANCE LOCUS RECEPTOR-LIKE PROTEIN KINASE-like 2.4 n=1 Tax=Abrus precatorius TaxID=3816 RepID=A0A8B8MCH8_ABRPR|nr:LEAF RUST 10 DISEASE-RESISTANCE LOCUS RECEPTOR-LIKE PROTEIN KINASE-like 2.4 [Abrus precatorius]
MSPVYEFVLLLWFSHLMPLLLASGHQGECPTSFNCGYLGNIGFPFTITQRPHCGLFPIPNCDDRDLHKPKSIQLDNQRKPFLLFQVLPRISDTTTTLHLRDNTLYELLQNRSCEAFTNNYTLPRASQFAAFSLQYSATLFRCNRTRHVKPATKMKNYKCDDRDYDLYYGPELTADDPSLSSSIACTKVLLPIKDVPDAEDPFTFVASDLFMEVKLTIECVNCHYQRGGQCQLDSKQSFYCAISYEKTRKKIVVTALTLVAAGVVVLMILACCFRTKISSPAYLLYWRKNRTHAIIEEFLKEHGPLPTGRYSYSEVKKMTNSFKNKLGQGGYGCVFKGKLHDGCLVAVKILSKSEDNGEEFINEVASISRTSHVNIVRLLGFCFDGSKRALIYEFMPNGSLEKFIYEEKNPLQVARQLDCNTLYDIAIGVARGLEYLHRGCNTRILHFDIKPHNILLDEDFCPKISDFGLAKICPRKESSVSMFGTRGTVGYIAPEVFSRNFGAVSHKSDVYSFGMMVLEMVGIRKNIKPEVDHSSEIYFPHWIYNRLESNQELCLLSIRNESDNEKARKMTIVGLWCIQTIPSNRPTISKVLEMLEGRVELLQMPPKPFFSPSSSPVHLSCETVCVNTKI